MDGGKERIKPVHSRFNVRSSSKLITKHLIDSRNLMEIEMRENS